MSADWPEVRLEDVTSRIGDGLHGTPKYDDNGEYYFINGNNLSNGKIIFDEKTKKSASEEYLKHRKDINDRTILVSINGTLGNVALYNGEKVFLGKSACYLNVLDSVDKQFIRYVICSNIFQTYISSLATGSTIKNVSLKLMRDFRFKLPPIEVQTNISKILVELDDKIALNSQTNQTLESIAQAIFKSWFVDFDPVKAKMAAKEAGASPADIERAAMCAISGKSLDELNQLSPDTLQQLKTTAALFPDALVESELGLVPEGWGVSKLGSILEQRVERISPSEITENLPYIPIDCISPKSLFLSTYKRGVEAQSSLTRIYKGDFIFGAMRAYFHKVCISPFDATTRTTAFVLKPINEFDFSFSVIRLFEKDTIDYASLHSTGSTIPYAKWDKSLSEMPVILPPEELRMAFNDAVKPILESMPPKLFEVESLTRLRDALLPKLLSGEIEVGEVA